MLVSDTLPLVASVELQTHFLPIESWLRAFGLKVISVRLPLDTWPIRREKYSRFFAIFFKIIDRLVFQQRVFKAAKFYVESRGNWHMAIQFSNFRHQFPFERNKKLKDRKT